MSRFAPALRRTARELDLPRRARAAILLEMAADLEAVFEHHRARGVGEEEAARRAEETVLGSSEVVRRLATLHRRSWREWSEELGDRLGRGTDLLLLLLAVVPMLGLAGAISLPIAASGGGLLAWAVIGSGVAVAGLVGSTLVRFHGGTSGPALRRALPRLLLLSALAPALGLLALALGVQGEALAVAGGAADADAQLAAVGRIARDGSLFAVGLLVGIAGSLAWFVLMNRASVLEIREVDALLESGPESAPARHTLSLVGRRS